MRNKMHWNIKVCTHFYLLKCSNHIVPLVCRKSLTSSHPVGGPLMCIPQFTSCRWHTISLSYLLEHHCYIREMPLSRCVSELALPYFCLQLKQWRTLPSQVTVIELGNNTLIPILYNRRLSLQCYPRPRLHSTVIIVAL